MKVEYVSVPKKIPRLTSMWLSYVIKEVYKERIKYINIHKTHGTMFANTDYDSFTQEAR